MTSHPPRRFSYVERSRRRSLKTTKFCILSFQIYCVPTSNYLIVFLLNGCINGGSTSLFWNGRGVYKRSQGESVVVGDRMSCH